MQLTIQQVAAGEVAWSDYIGNALADVFSKVAASKAELPSIVSQEIKLQPS